MIKYIDLNECSEIEIKNIFDAIFSDGYEIEFYDGCDDFYYNDVNEVMEEYNNDKFSYLGYNTDCDNYYFYETENCMDYSDEPTEEEEHFYSLVWEKERRKKAKEDTKKEIKSKVFKSYRNGIGIGIVIGLGISFIIRR